jgi:hypothetical protein
MRTAITETKISQNALTPFPWTPCDTTAVSTTLSSGIAAADPEVPVTAYTDLKIGDVLLLGGTEKVLITPTTYTVIIDATGTPDHFKWRKNGGTWTSGVAITGSSQTLADGVTITFAATSTHTLADQWVITVDAGAIGAVVFTGSGVNDATSGGAFSGMLDVTRGVLGTAAIALSTSATVVNMSVGNVIAAPSASEVLLVRNTDTSPHYFTLYGAQGSLEYAIPGPGQIAIGRLALASFAQPGIQPGNVFGGQLWFNGDDTHLQAALLTIS